MSDTPSSDRSPLRFGFLGGKPGWHFDDLARAVGVLGHQLLPLDFRYLRASVELGTQRVVSESLLFEELDAILVRAMPFGSLEQVVFRMDALAQLQRAGGQVLQAALH